MFKLVEDFSSDNISVVAECVYRCWTYALWMVFKDVFKPLFFIREGWQQKGGEMFKEKR